MSDAAAAISNRTASEDARAADFTLLVREHQAMVFSIALRHLRDRSAAEEVAQEVFLQLYRQQGQFEGPTHTMAWLRRVTCHRSIDYARKRKFESRWSLDDLPEPSIAPPAADPLLSQRLRRLVDSLPEKARLVVVLRYQEEMDPEEIARALEIPVRTVRSQLHRSLELLRQKFGHLLGDN